MHVASAKTAVRVRRNRPPQPTSTMHTPSTPRILVHLGRLQTRYPWRFFLVAMLSLVPAIWATLGLGFRADFAELLPDNKPSVIEMRRVAKRLAGTSTFIVVADVETGGKHAILQRFVDDLAPRLQALGPQWVGSVDVGTQETRRFFDQHKMFFADVDDLQKAHDDVLARFDYEIAKRTGDVFDEDDAPPPINAESLRKRLLGNRAESLEQAVDDPSKGYYIDKAGTFAAIVIRTPVSGKDATIELRRIVDAQVAAVGPKHFDSTMEVHYQGDLISSSEEYDAVIRDLSSVGFWGVTGVLLCVLLFFWRARVIVIMGATLMVGVLWTFGLTRFTIGYLNSSTGFLVSIIVGNGVNYSIIYMARYIEARRDQGLTPEEAVPVAHRETWIPTLASAGTAMLAYGSLMVTDFRGFKHFGVIGSYGMLLCWMATYVFTPAILVASERILPVFRTPAPGTRPSRARNFYGLMFAWLSARAPRTIAVAGALATLVCVGMSARYLLGDPMEYDMDNLRSDSRPRVTAGSGASARPQPCLDDVVGRLGQDGMAVLTDRVDQVPMLEAELAKRYEQAPANAKPFERVVSIFSVLPRDQERKAVLINEMRDRILRAKAHGVFSDADWKSIEPYVPAADVRPIELGSLPVQVARPFMEADGTRGRIVYIVPTNGASISDGHYLMRWADSFRATTLPTGEVIQGSGRAVIFADMIKTIGEDAPKAIAVSALGSIAIILVAFRNHRHAWGVFLPWLLGLSGLLTYLLLAHIKLNFLNFVALPITIGIGAEYAHNLMQRYRFEGPDRIQHVVTETGGAVILCSLTTVIGYLALLLSINRGIVSFGLAGAAGEISCVLAAVLVLPAALQWLARRTRTTRPAKVGERRTAPPPPRPPHPAQTMDVSA